MTIVDRVIHALGAIRAKFACEALQSALQRLKVSVMERQHQAGYTQKPVVLGEFDGWESEQVWGDV